MSLGELERRIDDLSASPAPDDEAARAAVAELLEALESGNVRAAQPDAGGEWVVNGWVKRGILLGFRVGRNRPAGSGPVFRFVDRDTFPTLDPGRYEGRVRIVPGGSSVRRGSHLGDGVVIMPPSYVNVGAWVGASTMVDSHVLVGSCAQIGRDVHLSAGVQVGGVLEPIGSRPVIVEDGAFIGGGCGLYEGARVGAGAVLAPGVILSAGVPVYDLVRDRIYRAEPGQPLSVPGGAVVVPGSRPARGAVAREHGVQLQTPVIVKYRDDATAAHVVLEEALR